MFATDKMRTHITTETIDNAAIQDKLPYLNRVNGMINENGRYNVPRVISKLKPLVLTRKLKYFRH